jgi:hypothetical protein
VQNHLVVPKSPKRDAFSLFQSKTSIFHDEETPFTSFPGANKARMKLLQSPKFSTMVKNKKSDDRQTHTHTNIQNKEQPTHSKFKFQIQIAQKRPRGSERCEKDHTAITVTSDARI